MHPPIYLPPAELRTYLPTYLPAYLTYRPTYLPTYKPTILKKISNIGLVVLPGEEGSLIVYLVSTGVANASIRFVAELDYTLK